MCCKGIEKSNDADKTLQNNITKTNIPEPKYCIVNANNILWTCHKACNIKFGDCDYCLCCKCYSGKTVAKVTTI